MKVIISTLKYVAIAALALLIILMTVESTIIVTKGFPVTEERVWTMPSGSLTESWHPDFCIWQSLATHYSLILRGPQPGCDSLRMYEEYNDYIWWSFSESKIEPKNADGSGGWKQLIWNEAEREWVELRDVPPGEIEKLKSAADAWIENAKRSEPVQRKDFWKSM